jgi:hypothetical protein
MTVVLPLSACAIIVLFLLILWWMLFCDVLLPVMRVVNVLASVVNLFVLVFWLP